MKTISTLLLLNCCLCALAQEDKIQLQGKIINQNGNGVSDVYIINTNNLEKDITKSDGIFTLTVSPTDTLIISHISYHRKQVNVYTLLKDPVIILESDNITIPEITVTPDKINDYDRAKKNLSFLKDYKAGSYSKIKLEANPLQTMMTEHNRLMRTEAGSINLLQFPLETITKLAEKQKRKRNSSNDYFSTRKQKELVPEK